MTEKDETKHQSRLASLQRINTKYVYVLMLIVISIPILRPIGLPLGTISDETTRLYQYINNLPERSIVVMIADQSPAAAAECQPGMVAILRHCATKVLRVVFYAPRTEAVPFITQAMISALGKASDNPDYGKLYVNLGFIPQGEVGLAALAANILYTGRDAYGQNLSSMPFFKDITDKTAHSWRLAIYFGANSIDWVIRQISDVYPECKVGAGVAAVLAPTLYPYYPQTIVGFLTGLRGSAEYEELVNSPGDAAAGMDAQSLGHLAIVLIVILGNVGYLVSRRRGPGGSSK